MNLCLYSSQQEENIYIRKQARTWQHSGLITNEQLAAMYPFAGINLRQTNIFFRVIFFVFTCLCVSAVLGLFFWITKIRSEMVVSFTLIITGAIIYALAEYTVNRHHLYRYGIEEALAVSSVVLFCMGIYMGIVKLLDGRPADFDTLLCLLYTLTALWIYLRFGFLYAAFMSIVAICVIPFQQSMTPSGERLCLLILLCLILGFIVISDKPADEDFKKEKNAILQAFLLAAIYLTVNLQIITLPVSMLPAAGIFQNYPKSFPPYIYWASYVLTFILPVAGIYEGIKYRKRLILNLSLVMACVTMATNKIYLGWTRYAWDPAILGIMLVILSMSINKWLNSGENQSRYGFTAKDILKPESHGISLTEVAAALTPAATGLDVQQSPSEKGKYFDGGASGGGGTSRNF
ncbi:MAG TPA: hypothetical protein PLV50_14710 [Smithella sp.]|nr:hypothetical protein [Smithella sp.]HQQ87343.1 hypothetical protein [Smithellaceae bacterium]MDM7987534.1 hypothetical protein [Smithella sp.]HNY51536.1 hypothetical protein [Smithella sp.]HOG91792.1 hypothetical protein [Smithella sp.]